MPKEELINVINPKGRVVSISKTDLPDAIQFGGYKEASDKDLRYQELEDLYGHSLEQQIKAVGQGALKSIPGVGGKITKAITDREAREAREEFYPGSVMAGEVAGIAAQSAIPFSPIAGISRAGRAVEGAVQGANLVRPAAKTFQTIAGKAAGSAVDAAIYEVGREANEADLGDERLTPEMALAAVRRGALFGASGGALFGSAKAASKAIKDSAVFNAVKDRASNPATRAATMAVDETLPNMFGLKKIILEKIEKSTVLKNIDDAARKTAKAIDVGTSNVFKHNVTPMIASTVTRDLPEGKTQRIEDFKTVQNEITNLKNNPELFISTLSAKTDALSGAAPNMTAAVMTNYVRAVSYLDQAMPKPPQTAPLTAEWVPNQTEVYNFMQKYNTVKNPTAVLEQISSGTLTVQAVEALKVVYPEMYKMMQLELLDKMAQKGNKIPYRTRNMLSLFFNEPFTDSVKQPSILANQASFNAPSRQSGDNIAAPRPVNPTQKGLGKLNVAGRSMTPMQRANRRTEQ